MTLTNQINDELEQKAWLTNPRGSTDAKSENFQGDINRVKRLKKEDVDHDLLLPVDDLQVLKADDDENDRGLLVKLLEDGSYEVAYWYDDLSVYPIEIVIDGESVKKDAKKVTFKFHPELNKSWDRHIFKAIPPNGVYSSEMAPPKGAVILHTDQDAEYWIMPPSYKEQSSAKMSAETLKQKNERNKFFSDQIKQIVNRINEKQGPSADANLPLGEDDFTRLDYTQSQRDDVFFDLAHHYMNHISKKGFPIPTKWVPSASERQSTLDEEDVLVGLKDLYTDKDVFMAIKHAAFGTIPDSTTVLDSIVKGTHPKVSLEKLYNTFSSTRDNLRQKYGDTMQLYRASEGKQMNKPTTNWASTSEIASQYGTNISGQDIPIDNILAVNYGSGSYEEFIVSSVIPSDKKIQKEGGGDGGGGAATSGSFGDGGDTVFTSTNSGIFTPTYGGNGRRKPKKRKRTGINRLADFVTNNSPERKMVKGTNPVTSFSTWAIEQLNKAKTPKGFTQQTSGETINNQPPRIEWQDQSIADDNTNEEKNPTEFKGHPDKGAADRQKNEERRIRSLNDSSDKQDSEPSYTGSAGMARPAGLNIRLAWGSGPEVDELARGGDLDEEQGEITDPNDPHVAAKYIEELKEKLNTAPYVSDDEDEDNE